MLSTSVDDIDSTMESIALACEVLVTFACMIFTRAKSNLIKSIMVMMADDWERHKLSDGRKVMHEYARRGTIITNGCIALVCLAWTSLCFSPILPKIMDMIRPLESPRPVQHMLNIPKFIDQDVYFYHTWLYLLGFGTILLPIILSILSMNFIFVQHACSMFYVLSSTLDPIAGDHTSEGEFGSTVHLNGRHCGFDHYSGAHYNIVKFLDLIEDMFKIPTLVVLLIGSPVFVCSLIQLERTQNVRGAITWSSWLQGALLTLFVFMNSGQRIQNHQEEFFRSMYNTRWYICIRENRCAMLMLMLGSSKNRILTMGKMIVLSHENFVTVCKGLFSIFTVLHSTTAVSS